MAPLHYSPGGNRSPPARRLNQMLGQGVREQSQGSGVGVNLDYVINGIQEMQDRQHERIGEMEAMLSTTSNNLWAASGAGTGT